MRKERSEKMNNMTRLDLASDIQQNWMLRIYQSGLVFFVPYLVYGGLVLYRTEMYGLISLPVLALIILGIGAGKRFKGHIIRPWIISWLLFGSGTVDLLFSGWMSDARLFLLLSIVVASLLIHKRAGYGFWGGANVLTLGYVVVSYAGWSITLPGLSVDIFTTRMLRGWFLFLCVSGGLTAAINYGLSRFFHAFQVLKAIFDEIREERESVNARTTELEELAENLHKKESILNANAFVSGSITAIQPLRSLLALTVDSLEKYYGFEFIAIYLLDETESWLVLQAASSESGKKLLAQGFRMPIDEMSVVGWVACNRQRKYGDFTGESKEIQTLSGFTALQSEAAFPLLIDDEMVGVLDLQTSGPAEFDEYVINALQNLTLELSLVMSAIRRIDGLPVEDIAQPFYHASQRIISARTDNAIYEAVVEALNGYDASRMTFVRQYSDSDAFYTAFDIVDEKISFTCQSVGALDFELLNVIAQYGSHLEKPAWLDGQKLEAIELPEELNQIALRSHNIESVAIIPARASESLTGILIVLFDRPHCFSPVEMRLCRLVTALSALAIERNALLGDVIKSIDHERVLGRIMSQLRLSLDPDAILRMTIQTLGQLLGAELTVVDLFVQENSPISKMVEGETELRNLVLQHQDRGYVYDGLHIQPPQPLSILDADVDLVIPLNSARSEFGNIKFKMPENQVLIDEDIHLAREIALEAGQALESARLYTAAQAASQDESQLCLAIQAVVAAETTEEALNAFVSNLIEPGIDRCMLLMNMGENGDAGKRFAKIDAAWEASTETSLMAGQVWDMRQLPFISADVCVIPDIASSADLYAISKLNLLTTGLRALMVVPLKIGEEITGWLLIGTLQAPFTFTGRQIRLYSHFAHPLSQALAHIRLVRATESHALEEQLTREALEHMREPVELEDVLDVAAYEMRRILDLDDVVIHLTLPESDKSHQ